jgi:hypothetical protein
MIVAGKILKVRDRKGCTATISTQFIQLADELCQLLNKNGYECHDAANDLIAHQTDRLGGSQPQHRGN